MGKTVPDGEYDLDFSALFATVQPNVFGLRYGFKPGTIDQSCPSFLYKDTQHVNDQTTEDAKRSISPEADIPCYLVCESKENTKAITTNHNKDDHIYFEGRSKPTTASSSQMAYSSSMAASESQSTDLASHVSSMSEFLLSYDDISKSFKVDCFNGFIKMSKSREPEIITTKIKKISHSKPLSSSSLLSKASSRSYADTLVSSFAAKSSATTTIKRSASPVRSTSTTPIDSGITKSYGKSISGISPVRRSASNSPMNSPTKNAFLPSSSLSPLPPIPTVKPSSPLRPSSTHTLITSQSPVAPLMKTSRSNSSNTGANGGMGLKKTTKSSLLRKAERSVGITSASASRISKPKLLPTVKDSLNATKPSLILDKNRESIGLRIRQREIKEARPDQAAFELNLTPPPPPMPPVAAPPVLSKYPDLERVSAPARRMMTKIRMQKEAAAAAAAAEKKKKANGLSDKNLEEFADEIGSEMDVDEDDTTIKIVPAKKSEPEKKDTSVQNASDDDFNIEFSDWEDQDAIDGPVASETELTAGPNDFQLIIEDDPLKSKRENEKNRKVIIEDDDNEDEPIKQSKPVKQIKGKNNAKPAPHPTNNLESASPKPKVKPSPKLPTKLAAKATPTKPSPKPKKKNGKHSKNAGHEDEEIDRELDAELDKAFDDLLDEEDMSEEE